MKYQPVRRCEPLCAILQPRGSRYHPAKTNADVRGRSGQECPEGAKFPPFGGASIASGYTPDALAGAKPRHPQPPKGEKGV